jgi:hypothetical protein
MDFENLGNNLDFEKLELLGHHQNHHRFERGHLESQGSFNIYLPLTCPSFPFRNSL